MVGVFLQGDGEVIGTGKGFKGRVVLLDVCTVIGEVTGTEQ